MKGKTTIKCKSENGSYLKITNEQSIKPSNEDKIYIAYDTELYLSDVSTVDLKNHRYITLTEPENGKYNYYIYDPHFVCVESDDADYTNNTPVARVSNNFSNDLDVQKKTYSPFIQKQITNLSKYSKTGNINLDTSCVYFSQRDNYTMPGRTCNSSSNAMYLNWLQRASGQSKILTNDDTYLRTVLQRGDTIYHENQTWALKQYGFNTVWEDDGNYSRLKESALAGFVVPINILHRGTRNNPRGGHVVCVIGYRQSDDWIFADPYGTFESGYTNVNGMYSFFSGNDMRARWQGGARYLA